MLKRSAASSSKPKFEYKKRSPEQYAKRANQSGGARNWFIKDDYQAFTPSVGSNTIRYLPSFEAEAEHWGMDVWIHFNVGSDNSAYLCIDEIRKHVPLLAEKLGKGDKCQGCIARREAQQAGELELEEQLAPKKRVLCWIIDRAHEKEGPKLWNEPFTIDRDVTKICYDRRQNIVYELDNPTEGYDLTFDRKGTDKKTEYSAFTIDRRESPLSDDEDIAEKWLKIVQENPLSECVIIPDQKAFADELAGTRVRTENLETESRRTDKKSVKESEPEPEKEEAKSEDDVTYEFVQKADRDVLEELALEQGYDEESVSEAEDDDLREAICSSLNLKPKKDASYKEKLKNLREKR